MITLPEKLRKALEKTIKELRAKENVYGVGLFGSWSRGDAAPSSDIDLFVFDRRDFAYEYVERVEVGGFLVDLDHVPRQWVQGPMPSEIDQKLYEMQILYDRDWLLTNMKLLMTKSYGTPERVDIRTEAHVVESDIYLSRATSAFSRQDFQSSCLFATVALENILKVLIEIALQPFSASRLVKILEDSAVKLGRKDLFNKYLDLAGLSVANEESVKEKLRLFKAIWNEMAVTAKQYPEVLESCHFTVKTKLNYYLSPAFLQGTVIRGGSLIDAGKMVEVSHYLNSVLLEILENYVWLKSSIDKVKIDYTMLMRSLENLEEKNPGNYENIAKFLGSRGVTTAEAADRIERTREIILKVRGDRKVLIKNYLHKS